jgi:hypothetical protein
MNVHYHAENGNTACNDDHPAYPEPTPAAVAAAIEATEYQGWANRETWAVHLWLANTEPYYRAAMYAARRPGPAGEEAISDLVDLIIGRHARAELTGDLLAAALTRVDWQAIVNAFREGQA